MIGDDTLSLVGMFSPQIISHHLAHDPGRDITRCYVEFPGYKSRPKRVLKPPDTDAGFP